MKKLIESVKRLFIREKKIKVERDIKRCTVMKYKRSKKYLVHCVSRTNGGPSIASLPYVWLERDVDKEQLVATILDVLSYSKSGLAVPTDWNDRFKKFTADLGLRKERDYYSDALYVSIGLEDGEMVFESWINEGRGGFVPAAINRTRRVAEGTSWIEIAKVLEDAFEACA